MKWSNETKHGFGQTLGLVGLFAFMIAAITSPFFSSQLYSLFALVTSALAIVVGFSLMGKAFTPTEQAVAHPLPTFVRKPPSFDQVTATKSSELWRDLFGTTAVIFMLYAGAMLWLDTLSIMQMRLTYALLVISILFIIHESFRGPLYRNFWIGTVFGEWFRQPWHTDEIAIVLYPIEDATAPQERLYSFLGRAPHWRQYWLEVRVSTLETNTISYVPVSKTEYESYSQMSTIHIRYRISRLHADRLQVRIEA